MLPEILSNNMCSLKPNEDKYTFSFVFTFNKENKIIKEWFGKTVINSNKRLTYNEAQHIIKSKTNIIPLEIALSKKQEKIDTKIKEAIETLNTVAEKLREKRREKGSISFNKKEVKICFKQKKRADKNNFKKIFRSQ